MFAARRATVVQEFANIGPRLAMSALGGGEFRIPTFELHPTPAGLVKWLDS